VACAQIVLRPSMGANERRHGFAAGARPSLSVDLERTPGAARTVVSLERCDGAGAPKTIEIAGASSFAVDEAFVRANVDALSCFRARANVYAEGGEWLGGAGAMTRLGDGVIEGSVEAPPGGLPGGEGLRGTRVSVAIEGMVLNAELVGADKFRFEHVPPGKVLAVRAEKRVRGASYRGEAFPGATMAGAETVSLKVALAAADEPLDSFEPDHSIKAVTGRAPLAPGVEQGRTLSSARDVDVVPVAAHAGRALWARVRPKGARADVALTLTDGAGARLAGANEGGTSPYQREPIASYAPTADGVLYLRVRRNDDEPGQLDYVLSVFEEGVKP
ncbi:MAG TPA: hypothetical protein VFS00_31425, partial [Polyangiaceae bacterium]|nr:hypothetical protein [Polyangiaceae bacterium]